METKVENCKWCGRSFIVNQNPIYKKGGFGWDYKGRKGYCSDRCKVDSEGSDNKSSSTGSSMSDGKNNATEAAANTAVANTELAKLNWEKEQVRKAEDAEKKTIKIAKSEKLKLEGRTFMAFVCLHQDNIGYFSIFIALILFMLFISESTIGIIIGIVIVLIYAFGAYKYFSEMFSKSKL